jgi:hypothetical protein
MRRASEVIGRFIGLLSLMLGLGILFRGGSLRWGIGLTAIGVIFLMNKIRKKDDW